MAVPSNRVPVRVARGLKSALVSNLGNLLEGELLYAKDEDKLYMVEGGALIAMGADLAASSIGDLSDVTITSASTGEVLRWNGSAWVDAQLDYSDLSGTPTLVSALNDLSDVVISSATTGEVLRYNGSAWVDAQLSYNDLSNLPTLGTAAAANTGDFATAAQGTKADSAVQPTDSIDVLADVDTTTAAPTTGQVLEWNGTNWVPATIAAGGVTQIVAGTNVTIDPVGGTGAVTINATGGGGGGSSSVAGTVYRVSETQTAASGIATFAGIGQSGLLVQATSDIDAWVVLYPTAAARTADAGRAYGTDPLAGSGVLAEFWIAAGTTVLASPGTWYFNNDATVSHAVYAAVRDQAGASVGAAVTITAYKHETGGIGGTSRLEDTVLASGGTADFTGIGVAGQFVSVTSDIDAWITFYGTAADRTSDSGRAFGTDPVAGDGVQADVFVSAGATVLMTPGMGYFNNDTTYTETIYTAVRDTSGVAANATVTVRAFGQGTISSISGGTFGSG